MHTSHPEDTITSKACACITETSAQTNKETVT